MYNTNGFSSTNIRMQSSIMEMRTVLLWKQIGINNNYFATPFISCLALR